jgi:hypothetical protein
LLRRCSYNIKTKQQAQALFLALDATMAKTYNVYSSRNCAQRGWHCFFLSSLLLIARPGFRAGLFFV